VAKKAQLARLERIPAITGSASAQDPWKRIAARIILQAVIDAIYSGRNMSTEQDRWSALAFLADEDIWDWSEAWGLSVPWRQVQIVIEEM